MGQNSGHSLTGNVYNMLECAYVLCFLIPVSFSHPCTHSFPGTDCGHSLSGSEPDVSTSTENLSPEERYALEHTQRQEPQGQENVSGTASSMANTQTPDSLISGASSTSNHRSNE